MSHNSKKSENKGEKGLKNCGGFVYGQPPTLFLLLQSFTFGCHLLAQWTILWIFFSKAEINFFLNFFVLRAHSQYSLDCNSKAIYLNSEQVFMVNLMWSSINAMKANSDFFSCNKILPKVFRVFHQILNAALFPFLYCKQIA